MTTIRRATLTGHTTERLDPPTVTSRDEVIGESLVFLSVLLSAYERVVQQAAAAGYPESECFSSLAFGNRNERAEKGLRWLVDEGLAVCTETEHTFDAGPVLLESFHLTPRGVAIGRQMPA